MVLRLIFLQIAVYALKFDKDERCHHLTAVSFTVITAFATEWINLNWTKRPRPQNCELFIQAFMN